MESLDKLYQAALQKEDLRTAFQIKALQAKIYNYWRHSAQSKLENMEEEEIKNLLNFLNNLE